MYYAYNVSEILKLFQNLKLLRYKINIKYYIMYVILYIRLVSPGPKWRGANDSEIAED